MNEQTTKSMNYSGITEVWDIHKHEVWEREVGIKKFLIHNVVSPFNNFHTT